MTSSILPLSICQAICQCNQPPLLISYSGPICDVIPAIDLANMPVCLYGNHTVPLGKRLNLTKYGIYHKIAGTLSFHMIYN